MLRYAKYVSRLGINDLHHQSVTQHKACCFTCTTWFVDDDYIFHWYRKDMPKNY